MDNISISAIGQDSHRFDIKIKKKLILGGVVIEHKYGLLANSDGDVILHAITNAISGLSGKNILGRIADKLCLQEGIKDSSVYLKEAMKYLNDIKIAHVSLSIECKKPKLSEYIDQIKSSLASLLGLSVENIGITATTSEGLTAVGKGQGIAVICIITGIKNR